MKKETPLQTLLCHSVTHYPEQIAITFDSRSISYKEFDHQTRCLAHGLLNEGIQSGDRVALFVPNCPEAAMALMACYLIGAVGVPLNYRYLGEEAQSILSRTQAKLLIFHEERKEIVASILDTLSSLPTIIIGQNSSDRPSRMIEELFSPEPLIQAIQVPLDHPALILFTSGSTGQPKGVIHSHLSTFASIDISRRIFNFTPQDIVLIGKPISHAGGLQTQLMPTLLVGGQAVLAVKPSPAEAVTLIRQHFISQYAMLASDLLDFIEYLEDHPITLPTLKNCMGSGDCVPTELHHRFKDLFGWEVMEGCGLTEVGTYYAVNPRYGQRKWGSLGLPSPDTRIQILGENGETLPIQQVGEIIIQTPSATIGYLDDPKATQALIHNGWLRTGDLGYIDDQNYIWFIGRKKLIIVRRGSNISPAEIENLIDEHPLVHASVVVGIPDHQDGQVPIAWVVPRSPVESPTEHELREYVSTRIAHYKTPVRYLFLKELPLTSTGKYDRVTLEERATSAFLEGQAYGQGHPGKE